MQKRAANPSKLMVVTCLGMTGFGIGWLIGLSVSPVVSIVITSITGAAAAVVAALSGLHDQYTDGNVSERPSAQPLRWTVNPLPLALLMLGTVIGTLLGIPARNYNWLGSDLSAELQKWSAAGLDQKEVARRLFEIQYPYTPYVRSKSLLHADLPAEYNAWLNATQALTNSTSMPLYDELTKRMLELEYPTTIKSGALISTAPPTSNAVKANYGSFLSTGTSGADRTSSDCIDLKGKQGAALKTELRSTQWVTLTAIITDEAKLEEIVQKVLCAGHS